MTPTTGDKSHSTYGWRARLMFGTQHFNESAAQYHQTHLESTGDHLPLRFELPLSQGRISQRVHCTLGRPLLSIGKDAYDDYVDIQRRFVGFQGFTLVRRPGNVRRDLTAVCASTADGQLSLFQRTLMSSCTGHYRPGERVRLTMMKGHTTFHVGYPGEQPIPATMFNLYLDLLSDTEPCVMLHNVQALPGSEWLMKPLRFYLRASVLPSYFEAYVAFESDSNGSFVVPDLAQISTLPEHQQQTEAAYFARLTLVDTEAMPGGYRLSDFYSATLLLHPPTRTGCTGAIDFDTTIMGLFDPAEAASCEHLDASPSTPMSSVTLDTTPSLPPLVEIVNADDPRLTSRFEYTSPIEPNTDGDSRPEAQIPTGIPVQVRRISTGHWDFPQFSTYVVLDGPPSCSINFSRAGEKLRLAMVYIDSDGVEQTVEPHQVFWSVLAGAGQVDAQGVFTPGALSNFSVVLASIADSLPRRWAVAIVPMPLATLDDVLNML